MMAFFLQTALGLMTLTKDKQKLKRVPFRAMIISRSKKMGHILVSDIISVTLSVTP